MPKEPMGSETEKSAKSAINSKNRQSFPSKRLGLLWRPLAIVALSCSSAILASDQQTVDMNISALSNQISYSEEHHEQEDTVRIHALRDESKIENREACPDIKLSDYHSEQERQWYLTNCLVHLSKENPDTTQVLDWLEKGGWQSHMLLQASSVTFCESRNNPHAHNPDGPALGLFGLDPLWFSYAGEDVNQWADPVVNSRVALATYNYDIQKGQEPWSQWSCKPESL